MENGFRIIIDGYNLIFQCGLEGRSRSPLALEKARARLLNTLASRLNETDRIKTAVVFDAAVLPIRETEPSSQVVGISVYYAIAYDDADTMIEEMIAKNSVPKQLVVVSSDHRLHKAALRRKSKPVDSDVWFESLQNRVAENSGTTVSPAEAPIEKEIPGLEELQSVDWLSEFGFDENPEPPKRNFNPFPPGYGEDALGEP